MRRDKLRIKVFDDSKRTMFDEKIDFNRASVDGFFKKLKKKVL